MKHFSPKLDQTYYMINSRFQVKETKATDSQKSRDRIAAGNAFPDRKTANAFAYMVKQGALGNFTGFQRQPFIARLLTWIVYLLLVLLVIAACCLVIDFIFWIFDIKVTLPSWLTA